MLMNVETLKAELVAAKELRQSIAGYTAPGDTRGGLFSTKIIEAEEVNIHILRPLELTEVALLCGGKSYAFYVADRNKPRPEGFADEIDFYFSAFIENSSGATTESVRF